MSNTFLKLSKYDDESSDDSINSMKTPDNPIFYMIPTDKHPFQLIRKNLKTKYQILSKFHKDSEDKLYQNKIGWHTLYEFFFEKYFLFDKNKRNTGIFLNFKEIEIRVRKEIGKIDNDKLTDKKNTVFDIFDKIEFNPPISVWYSHNFISNPSNKLISFNEESSFVGQIITQFNNENKNKEYKKIDDDDPIKFLNKREKDFERKKNRNKTLKQKTKINFEKFKSKNNSNSNDDVAIKLIKVTNENNKGDEIALKKEIIPKGVKKLVEKFSKQNNLIPSIVEEEITNLNNDRKAYETEILNSKMFDNNFIESHRFLIDFDFLNKIIDSQSKEYKKLNLKKEMNDMLDRVDKIINFTQNLSDDDN